MQSPEAHDSLYRPDGCSTNEKYALTRPITRIPVMISARERMMCPNTPITTPSASAAVKRPRWDEAANTSVSTGEPYIGSMQVSPTSVQDVADGLKQVGYLPGESTALVSYLAAKLGKPVLVEGPAGVGKTELAKALSRYLKRTLVRLQCYEGLDEAKALYEWNYRKQLLRIQTESDGTGWQEVQEDIFGEEFLLQRPLMAAIASAEPVVLLIDEIDKTDQEFEAMLLELLSDFQISIPELGRIEAKTHPVVLLTSNNTRELTEALKRRCLYLWLDYPELEHELAIVRLHSPELDETVARKLVEVVHQVRELDLKKPPSIAESIDWARALILLGADDLDQNTFKDTMSVIVKHRTDLDTVAARVGVKLDPAADARPAA
jgi:MoxR-like ATPase